MIPPISSLVLEGTFEEPSRSRAVAAFISSVGDFLDIYIYIFFKAPFFFFFSAFKVEPLRAAPVFAIPFMSVHGKT